ncbi:hypothetical protein HMPREF1544_11039 [Mucor circinelloides 1006PhL]|uniref:protein S-acyltransferase n=1 Tax=Mucor circinelloides f. circinelloides (strain 1006PhL) TaxID=1220926 RepID=S2IY95_MUCC1|nr:hypothetical protein HMPREF1544_11039 [Mucor circinelloides 1006PhL]
MSEPKPENKVMLPFPFLVDSSAAAPTHSLPHHMDSFRFGNMPTEEESFEQFDLSNPPPPPPPPAVHSNVQLQHRIPHTQQQQQQQQQTIEQPRIIQGKRQLHTRNYKMYNGKMIFFCGGRFLTSRAVWAFCISLFLLIMPSVLFLIFTCPWLWHHISPAVPIIFAYIFCITLSSMLKTSWTDPGIIPRNLDIKSMNPHKDDPNREVIIKGVPVRLKYCETCCIYRPPRASHCRQCDNCKMKTTTAFGSIIALASETTLHSLPHVLLVYTASEESFQASLLRTPISFFVAIFCFVLLLPVGCLTGYHCFLVMRGVTTHEQLRSNLASMPFEDHPYNFGNPFKNMYHILCRPHNKSYIARRKFAEEIYDVQPNQAANSSNLSTTVQDELGQISTLDTIAASNIPLQNR